jgi:hypothetical protein
MAREKLKLGDFENRFSRDGNRLFFDDNEVQTAIHLNAKQTALAAAVAIFAILSAAATCINAGVNVWSTFYKKPVSSETSGSSKQVPPVSSTVTPTQEAVDTSKAAAGVAGAGKASITGNAVTRHSEPSKNGSQNKNATPHN